MREKKKTNAEICAKACKDDPRLMFLVAAKRGDTDLVVSLLDEGEAQIDLFIDREAEKTKRRDLQGKLAVTLAACRGHAETVKVLLSKGAPIHHPRQIVSPLLSALGCKENSSGVLSIVFNLIEAKINPNEVDEDTGDSALMLAIEREHWDALPPLIEAGCVAAMVDDLGSSPLPAAASKGHLDSVELLLKNRADPEIYKATSPLCHAVDCGSIEMVRLLIGAGAKVRIETLVAKPHIVIIDVS